MKTDDILTTGQAAAMLRYHIGHVQRLLRLGTLRGQKFNRSWLIPREEVERVKDSQSKGGRYYPPQDVDK